MTSGNFSDAPQLIDDDEARERLAGIADYALVHDRRIVTRLDEFRGAGDGRPSPRVAARTRLCARPDRAAPGLEAAPPLLAFGGELKATFCLVKDGHAILSQHLGDLENAETFDDYQRRWRLYADLFEHEPAALVADRHPDYLSSKLAREPCIRQLNCR